MNKITETDILDIKSKLSKLYPLQKLCLVIHPSKEQEIIDIMNSHLHVLPPWETDPIAKAIVKPKRIISFLGMRIYKDEFCPIDKIHILPELEYQNMRKTLL